MLSRERQRRIIALFTAIMIFSVIILSTIYIIGESRHQCNHHCCPVCSTIELSLTILTGPFTLAAVALSTAVTTFIFTKKMRVKWFLLVQPTLTTLKTRIDC